MIEFFIRTWQFMARTEIIVAVIVAAILLACFILLLTSVLRRLINARKYRTLDGMRDTYLPVLREIVGGLRYTVADLEQVKATPGTLKWRAVEDCLVALLDESPHETAVTTLFERLGYLEHYRRMLDSPKVLDQAAAITRLGELKERGSGEKLLELLKKGNREITAAVVRALCKISDETSLERLLNELSGILDRKLLSLKSLDTSLGLLEPSIIPILLKFAQTCPDARIVSSILKVLGNVPPNQVIYGFAVRSLGHESPEVRAKAAKVIANFEISQGICNHEVWPRLLGDPVWFVRLQTVRVMGKQQCRDLVNHVAALLNDEKWQVRNAAVEALINLGEDSIDILLKVLKSTDQYAKESICEVMHRTGFVDRLLAWLDEGTPGRVESIYNIFAVMVSHGFTSHLENYIERAREQGHVPFIQKMLSEKAA